MTPRVIQAMCAEGRIEGVIKSGRAWTILTGKYKNWRNKSLVSFTGIGEEYDR